MFFKRQRSFFQCLVSNFFISKKLSVKELWPILLGNRETAETVIWFCESIILSLGHFKGSTLVQENSWWKRWPIQKIRLILSKPQWVFFQCLAWKFIHFRKLILTEPLADLMLQTANCSDCQMALWTDHFLGRIFRRCNWSPNEQEGKNRQTLINKQFRNAA